MSTVSQWVMRVNDLGKATYTGATFGALFISGACGHDYVKREFLTEKVLNRNLLHVFVIVTVQVNSRQ